MPLYMVERVNLTKGKSRNTSNATMPFSLAPRPPALQLPLKIKTRFFKKKKKTKKKEKEKKKKKARNQTPST